MARYLTPAKIGLLVLVELYVEETMPADAIVPVLSFITSHLIEKESDTSADEAFKPADRWRKAERTVSLVISIKDFEKLLGSYPFLMGMPGRKMWDQFLDKLWGINSLDALHEFMEGLEGMLAKTKEQRRQETAEGIEPEPETGVKVTRHSIFGMFIRRAALEFGRLRFTDSAELWRNFVKYRQPTFVHMRRKNAGLGRLSFDNVLMHRGHESWDPAAASTLARVTYGDMLAGDHDNIHLLPVSSDDVETLLEFQIQQMQTYGSRIPLEIRRQFHDLLNDCFVLPSLRHYLTFLDAWRSGDYTTSFDYLYRYFDYTMQNRDRLFYQYALMNLAVLQADFGCFKEAVSAMLETVSTARENRDMTCLNFALNWLFHFGRANPELVRDLESNSMLGTGKETLAYLRVKAKETGMWSLWSSGLLSEAKLSIINGESMATAMESIIRSSQVIVEKNMKPMFGSQLAMTAAVWDRLGVPQMGNMISEVFLRCRSEDTIFHDELRITCRLAVLLAEKGQYEDALARLDELDENAMRTSKSNVYWHKYRGIIKLKRDLHHNNLEGAEAFLEQLLQIKVDDLEPDMAVMIDSLNIECLIRRGNLEAASTKVEKELSSMADEDNDVGQKLRLMLWEVYLLEKCGRPLRGFTIAMRAASIAWRARIMPHLYEALGYISHMLTALGEFDASIQLLTATIPRALECESSRLPATLYSYLADANMGLAGQHEPRSVRRNEYMTSALDAVQRSFDYWSEVEDTKKQCELMAKRAMIMKIWGDMKLAASYAAAYVSLKKNADLLASN